MDVEYGQKMHLGITAATGIAISETGGKRSASWK